MPLLCRLSVCTCACCAKFHYVTDVYDRAGRIMLILIHVPVKILMFTLLPFTLSPRPSVTAFTHSASFLPRLNLSSPKYLNYVNFSIHSAVFSAQAMSGLAKLVPCSLAIINIMTYSVQNLSSTSFFHVPCSSNSRCFAISSTFWQHCWIFYKVENT